MISGVPLGARGRPTCWADIPPKANSKGEKNERLAHRVVAKGDFQVLADISEVVGKLFWLGLLGFAISAKLRHEFLRRLYPLRHSNWPANLLRICKIHELSCFIRESIVVAHRKRVLLQGSVVILQNDCFG